MKLKITGSAEFKEALRLTLQITKKNEAQVLNKWGLDACIKAYRDTPKADKQHVKAQLLQDALALKIVWKRARLAGERITKEEGNRRAKKLIAQRMRSVKYVALGFLFCGRDFGGRGPGAANTRSEAAKSYGKKASPNRLVALIGNNSRGADIIAVDSLNKAFAQIAVEKKAYALQKIQGGFNKHSARKN